MSSASYSLLCAKSLHLRDFQQWNPAFVEALFSLCHQHLILYLCASLLSDSANLWTVASPPCPLLLCSWDSPGKKSGVDCHALLQGIFLTQGSNPCLKSPALAGEFFTTSATWEVDLFFTWFSVNVFKTDSKLLCYFVFVLFYLHVVVVLYPPNYMLCLWFLKL